MPKSPAYLWYPKDIFDSERVDNLSAAEECWYRRALDRAWGDEGIVADPAKAAKRIGKKCTTKAAAMILKTFFVPKKKDPSKMVNLRQEKERKKYEDNFRKKSEAGKRSGQKRRQKKDLTPEQRSNGVQGVFEQPIPIPIPSSKEERKEDAATARAVFVGTVLAGVTKALGLQKLSPYAQRDWTQHADLAFDNGFRADEFVGCCADLNEKSKYPVQPQYVTDRLPAFVKSQKKPERLPTAAEKEAEARAQNALMRPAPKIEVEVVQ